MDEETDFEHIESSPWFITNGKLQTHTISGINWMMDHFDNGTNGILAEEMGPGKTLQTISLLGYMKHCRKIQGHNIVIVPKSTIDNWTNDFNHWCPTLKVVRLQHGSPMERNEVIRDQLLDPSNQEWNVRVTTFDTILSEKNRLTQFKWRYMIIDEAHRIKNEATRIAEAVREFSTCNRMLLLTLTTITTNSGPCSISSNQIDSTIQKSLIGCWAAAVYMWQSRNDWTNW